MLAVHPSGHNAQVNSTGDNLTVGLGPDAPDYAQIAAASGGAWGEKVVNTGDVGRFIKQAIDVVRNEKRCAVLDCVLEKI